MPEHKRIYEQQERLALHRDNLALYLRQRALLGEAQVTPQIMHGIAESRAQIGQIKAVLRAWGIAVENLPDDTALSIPTLALSNVAAASDTRSPGSPDMERIDEIAQAHRSPDQPAAIIHMDLDRFSKINSIYGSVVGDAVLQQIQAICRTQLENTDHMLLHWNADEFVVILPGATAQRAELLATQISKHIEQFFWDALAPGMYITGSFGVAQLTETESTTDWLLRAMHGSSFAKRAGGNQVQQGPLIIPPHISRRFPTSDS